MAKRANSETTLSPRSQRAKVSDEKAVEPKAVIEEDGVVEYYPQLLAKELSRKLYSDLVGLEYWNRPELKVYGRVKPQSRLTCAFGDDPNVVYNYSGTTALVASEYPAGVIEIKTRVEKLVGVQFNFCLLNYYSDGNEYIGAHSDNQAGLVPGAPIAAVSLGTERFLDFKHKKKNLKVRVTMEDGSLLVMGGDTQTFWKHMIPKQKKVNSGRISLTFRVVKPTNRQE
ncbi:hypothetical protein K493DRAFT_312140 [Basidiobolus meristosporus CBS 931.73]|uniref:Fe2OG dioxygenase domain-containing protein n=1 Tax=Basidiobolus meristosporus CBS 931.73 TaxID=1314790 RepID=A0A1Y1YW17_9FUNG|nr:hypothetical protein K493DRAFT_312140 [Basidiobolus meristosporus CBS 931.73]|eukprot:ORY02242.1 hypothetical protein K493DRAFT_312140 [Basidiobolus meristosporus CBS 931.73]